MLRCKTSKIPAGIVSSCYSAAGKPIQSGVSLTFPYVRTSEKMSCIPPGWRHIDSRLSTRFHAQEKEQVRVVDNGVLSFFRRIVCPTYKTTHSHTRMTSELHGNFLLPFLWRVSNILEGLIERCDGKHISRHGLVLIHIWQRAGYFSSILALYLLPSHSSLSLLWFLRY